MAHHAHHVGELYPASAQLTAERIAEMLDIHPRAAQRRVRRWFKRAWPVVRLERCRGNHRGRYVVDAESFREFLAGKLPPALRSVSPTATPDVIDAHHGAIDPSAADEGT